MKKRYRLLALVLLALTLLGTVLPVSAAVSWFLQTPGLLPIDNKPADTTAAPSTTAKPEEDLTPEEPQEPGFPVAGFFTPIVVAVVLSVSGVLLVGSGTVAVILILRKKKK